MTKVIEKNVAEIIVIAIFTIIIMSSCGSVKNTCAAYASAEIQTQEEYSELLACENCDQID